MDTGCQLDEATIRKLTKFSSNHKELGNMCRKIAFSLVTDTLRCEKAVDINECCGEEFESCSMLKKHISQCHAKEISVLSNRIQEEFTKYLSENSEKKYFVSDQDIAKIYWISEETYKCTCKKNFKVLLYYHYVDIKNTSSELSWQKALCKKLGLNGKIRTAAEGINGTAEGCECATEQYIEAMLRRFPGMVKEDFKLSDGVGTAFNCLKVTEYQELCSLGIPPEELKAADGARHLTPEEFHQELEKKSNDTILLDCRNFYESKIGHFEDAIKPNLRKFSYFPSYVDKNPSIFKGKRVLMYCTGGIRCERASAYIRKAGVCKDVLQLKGGIHKYLEKYPNGFYRGKLFVFDERYSIGGERQFPVSRCKYCDHLYDQYKLCSSPSCRQLVLSCDTCRFEGKTACCKSCQENAGSNCRREECDCTKSRNQVPVESRGITCKN